ncbi:MAG: hypothetical protein U0528_11735 [Anaerolineae bacterium]
MMRSLLLFLSTAKLARRVFMAMPFSGRLVRRSWQEKARTEAIAVTWGIERQRSARHLDHLGENVFTEDDANKATQVHTSIC